MITNANKYAKMDNMVNFNLCSVQRLLVKSTQIGVVMSTGEQIMHYRKLKGWTQTDLATKIGVKPSNISRWENDKVRPHSDTLQAIAEALGVTLDELASGSASVDPSSMQVLGAIEKLDEEDKRLVKRIVDALLTKKRVQAALEVG